MAPRAQPNDEKIERVRAKASNRTSPTTPRAPALDRDVWTQTDRLLTFPTLDDDRRLFKTAASAQVTRKRWLEENGVETEFLDGGIGCCWFASHGEREPVSGQTEDEAIARLARAIGLVWPGV